VGGVYDFGQSAIADVADGASWVLSCQGYTPNPVFYDATEGGWVIPVDGCIAIADDEDEGSCPALTFKNADSLIPLDVLQDWLGGSAVESFGDCGIADSSIGGSCVLEHRRLHALCTAALR
jgi:hypothetical protein